MVIEEMSSETHREPDTENDMDHTEQERKNDMANELTGSMPNTAAQANHDTTDIGKLIHDETEKRLAEMEKPGYEFPEQLKKSDWMAIAALCIGSCVLIALCMAGVIV